AAAAVDEIAREQGISFSAKQREAILAAVSEMCLVLTGGPGTGKTTTLAGILELFDRLERVTLLTAPTGRAAKRISELTGRPAATIHRLLEAQIRPETGQMAFTHDESDPLKCDAVIVDETSMVDLLLMRSLLCALPEGCTLILVGDPDQLPSVGAGNVFSDLIRSGVIETVRLTEIFRQARESLIVMNAHAVNRGELPVLTVRDRDFFFLRRMGGESLVQTVCELCARRLPQNMGIAPGDIQVLSPTRKGVAGTRNLNSALQAALNPPAPGKKEKKYGDFCFREGDRVMQIRNNYDIIWKRTDGFGVGAGIFNGDIGTVLGIDHGAEFLRVQFDDREAVYSFDMLSELELAYAMTVHKSQGSEYRAVILCAGPGSPYLQTRSVLYTAITRARELLICVGSEEVIAAMTANDRKTRRYSGLKLRMEAI
ncbi:MAG: AAA family ATPase, partial [Oscillospiraceae bacterium]|nr:AAA family ATPase [Oscillospiraceae bacterium]